MSLSEATGALLGRLVDGPLEGVELVVLLRTPTHLVHQPLAVHPVGLEQVFVRVKLEAVRQRLVERLDLLRGMPRPAQHPQHISFG